MAKKANDGNEAVMSENNSPRNITDKTVLSSEEAANFLKTTKAGLYALVQRGDIPFIRAGKRKLLFFKEDLLLMLESRTNKKYYLNYGE